MPRGKPSRVASESIFAKWSYSILTTLILGTEESSKKNATFLCFFNTSDRKTSTGIPVSLDSSVMNHSYFWGVHRSNFLMNNNIPKRWHKFNKIRKDECEKREQSYPNGNNEITHICLLCIHEVTQTKNVWKYKDTNKIYRQKKEKF